MSLTAATAGCTPHSNAAPVHAPSGPASPAPVYGGPHSTAVPTPGASPAVVAPNGVDLLFAKMMIPHHGQAVRMSRSLAGKTGVPERVVAVADYIAADQQREIHEMNAWLQAWGHPPVNPDDPANSRLHGRDAATHGMLTEEQVRAGEAAAPPTATRMFLEQMIEHHRGAITMAQSALKDGSNAYTRTLAKHIINEQSTENESMTTMLTELR
ncbi:DUF305 domain-containing protein [Actinoplanes sp. NEAU-A12]|uniref:DUF305 domain-containing protein n=1 Tax=Actinoplanes sandaracinus TaxID=3045177 RepID=A0ABT6WHV6_9ACTN|nr:DUF305 domain-containing protein [Actinoplanes sandaracinus]MDI6099288.1 DUF305 domain-containing protein [Actinoplanes sandaracinus]